MDNINSIVKRYIEKGGRHPEEYERILTARKKALDCGDMTAYNATFDEMAVFSEKEAAEKKPFKERFKNSMKFATGCLFSILLFALVFIFPFLLPEKILMILGISLLIVGIGSFIFYMIGAPFVAVAQFVRSKWKILVLGTLLLVLMVAAFFIVGHLLDWSNHDYYFINDGHRPDHW